MHGARTGRPEHFYPRSPCGERPGRHTAAAGYRSHFYPRSPCGERRVPGPAGQHSFGISIHALLAESDSRRTADSTAYTPFLSTLSLRRATVFNAVSNSLVIFLSTLSLRRATPPPFCGEELCQISIHALLAESDDVAPVVLVDWLISIHALLAESDEKSLKIAYKLFYFYPRSPCGERRAWSASKLAGMSISIHALLAESDLNCSRKGLAMRYFYPRSPCGERPKSDTATAFPLSFLSTLSLRRATLRVLDGSKSSIISIHALLAESDIACAGRFKLVYNFYPRSPCGERRLQA